MITQFFKSKRSVLVLPPPSTQSKWVGNAVLSELERATKRGLSVEEYRHRCGVVARAQIGLKMFVGDTMWPHTYAAAQQHGKVMVRGIVRHFDDYGDVVWNEPPFILAVSPLKEQTRTIHCTGNWVVKDEPVEEGVQC